MELACFGCYTRSLLSLSVSDDESKQTIPTLCTTQRPNTRSSIVQTHPKKREICLRLSTPNRFFSTRWLRFRFCLTLKFERLNLDLLWYALVCFLQREKRQQFELKYVMRGTRKKKSHIESKTLIKRPTNKDLLSIST